MGQTENAGRIAPHKPFLFSMILIPFSLPAIPPAANTVIHKATLLLSPVLTKSTEDVVVLLSSLSAVWLLPSSEAFSLLPIAPPSEEMLSSSNVPFPLPLSAETSAVLLSSPVVSSPEPKRSFRVLSMRNLSYRKPPPPPPKEIPSAYSS